MKPLGEDLILGWQITITVQRRLTKLLTAISNVEATRDVSVKRPSGASLVSVGSLHTPGTEQSQIFWHTRCAYAISVASNEILLGRLRSHEQRRCLFRFREVVLGVAPRPLWGILARI